MKQFSKILTYFRDFGLAYTYLYVKKHVLNKFFFHLEFEGMYVTNETLLSTEDNPKEYKYRFLSEAELIEFAGNEVNEMSLTFTLDAISRGDKCYGVLLDNVLASYGWYSSVPTKIKHQIQFCFDNKWTYMYKGYTLPKFRGKRLHAIGMPLALKELSQSGSSGLISYVETNNVRSLRSVYRMGYKKIGRVSVYQIGKWFSVKTEPSCDSYGLTVKKIHN